MFIKVKNNNYIVSHRERLHKMKLIQQKQIVLDFGGT